MLLEKIISISGKPGLFKLVSQMKNGFIIQDVSTQRKISINNSAQVSLLDNIMMYTFDSEVPLFDVFENIAKAYDYKETISHKSSEKELRDFMVKALPEYDVNRVYLSDIKKLAQWYNILSKAGYITPESFVKEPNAEENLQPVQEASAPKPVSLSSKKTSSSAKSTVKSTHRKQG